MDALMAIDPGNTESAYVRVDMETYEPLTFSKDSNDLVRYLLKEHYNDEATIEKIESYGMAVGKEVFDTCIETGRFLQIALDRGLPCTLTPRKEVKLHLCKSARAKDSNIIQALKDRFGGKGTKKAPGFFYGFKADCWQAFALAVTYIDKKKGVEQC